MACAFYTNLAATAWSRLCRTREYHGRAHVKETAMLMVMCLQGRVYEHRKKSMRPWCAGLYGVKVTSRSWTVYPRTSPLPHEPPCIKVKIADAASVGKEATTHQRSEDIDLARSARKRGGHGEKLRYARSPRYGMFCIFGKKRLATPMHESCQLEKTDSMRDRHEPVILGFSKSHARTRPLRKEGGSPPLLDAHHRDIDERGRSCNERRCHRRHGVK